MNQLNNDLEINRGFEFLLKGGKQNVVNQYISFSKELVLSLKGK